MSFDPEVVLSSSVRVAEEAEAVRFVLKPSSFVHMSRRHHELAYPGSLLVLPLTIIVVPLEPFHDANAILLPLYPLAFIFSSTHFNWLFHYSPAVSLVV